MKKLIKPFLAVAVGLFGVLGALALADGNPKSPLIWSFDANTGFSAAQNLAIELCFADGTCQSTAGGGGGGGVSSVGLNLPTSMFVVTGTPVTGAGTLKGAFNKVAANLFWAGPVATPSATPSYRALNDNDFPSTLSLAITDLFLSSLTPDTALIADSGGNLASSSCTDTELGFVHGVTSAIQTQLNGKQPSGTYVTSVTAKGPLASSGGTTPQISVTATPSPTASTIAMWDANSFLNAIGFNASGLTASTATVTDASDNLASSVTTATELAFVHNVTSAIQTQLNSKQATGSYITSLTSDVVASGPGAAAATIQANVVDNTKLAQMATHTIKGNNTSGTANALDLTVAQLNTLLGVVTSVTATPPLATSGGATPNISVTATPSPSPVTIAEWDSNSNINANTAVLTALTASSWVQTDANKKLTSANNISSVGVTLDGGGSVISTGLKGFVTVPYSGTVSEWVLICDQSGSIVIDVWRVVYSGFPGNSGNSIAGTDLPTLSSAQKNRNQSISGWTSTTITANDILEFNVNSATTVTRCNLVLQILKS